MGLQTKEILLAGSAFKKFRKCLPGIKFDTNFICACSVTRLAHCKMKACCAYIVTYSEMFFKPPHFYTLVHALAGPGDIPLNPQHNWMAKNKKDFKKRPIAACRVNHKKLPTKETCHLQTWYHLHITTHNSLCKGPHCKLFQCDSTSPSISLIQGGFVLSSVSSSTHTTKREEGEKEDERKMRHEKRLPSSAHLLIAPKRGFRRPLLCKRFTCLLSHSEAIHSVLRHYSTNLFITTAVYHQRRCKERQTDKKRLSLKCLQQPSQWKKSNRLLLLWSFSFLIFACNTANNLLLL